MIEGAVIVPLRRIPDERGTIIHMLRERKSTSSRFGADLLHDDLPGRREGVAPPHRMTLNYACRYGRVKLVLYDDREGSPTRGALHELYLGPDNHSLAVIPPEVWNGVKGMSAPFALLANCCTHAHDPSRTTGSTRTAARSRTTGHVRISRSACSSSVRAAPRSCA